MAIAVKIDGKGTRNLTGYSVVEDATPLDPSATTGGVGSIGFAMPSTPGTFGSIHLQDKEVTLYDNLRGTLYGIISETTEEDYIVDVTSDSKLQRLVANTTVDPISGTFKDVIYYYLSFADIYGGVVIDPALENIPLVVPGWYGEVWLHLKQLCAVYKAEIALVGGNIVFRPIRSFALSPRNVYQDKSRTISRGESAQFIECEYYSNTWLNNTLVYPKPGQNARELKTWQLDAGAVLEDDIELDVSLLSVEQPFARDDVSYEYSGGESVYCVVGRDDHALTAAEWTASGGNIELSINEDTTSLHIKITAPQDSTWAPFRIVGVDDPVYEEQEVEDYPSLRIIGTGVATNTQVITVPTGVPASKTANKVGVRIQNPNIRTVQQAYDAAVRVAGLWSGSEQEISATVAYINTRSELGRLVYPTFADFEDDNTGKTFSDFSTQFAGKTFKEFTAFYAAQVEDVAENQTFGNVAGARIKIDDAIYRVSSATITPEDISFSAVRDTTIGDFKAAFAGMTFADFKNRYQGLTFKEFSRIPLAALDAPPPIDLPLTTIYPDNTTYPLDLLYPA